MSERIPKETMEEMLRQATAGVWQSGGAGREALREELRKEIYWKTDLPLIKKYPDNPILEPESGTWYDGSVGNPMVAVDPETGKYVMIFAGWDSQGVGPKQFGYAESDDGIVWEVISKTSPVLSPDMTILEQDLEGGCLLYDAVKDVWYLYYTAIGADDKYRTAVASSEDLINWTKHGIVIDVGGAGEFDELWAGEPAAFKFGPHGLIAVVYTARDAAGTLTFGGALLDSWTHLATKETPSIKFRGTSDFWDEKVELHHFSKNGDYWTLLYEGQNNNHRFWKIGIAFSKNNVVYGRAGQPLISEEAEWYAGFEWQTWHGTVHPYLVKWRDRNLLYYTEVRKAGAKWWVGNRISVAFVDPRALYPGTYELYWDIWVNETIPVAGSTSYPITTDWPCDTTIFFFSDQDGTLDIEVDPINISGASDYRGFDTGLSVSANTLFKYQTSYRYRRLRLTFTPTAEATVSAFAITSPRRGWF